jgi:hypothetical protein
MHMPTERLIVLMDDDCIHTTAHPMCTDSDCPCQQDAQEAKQRVTVLPASTQEHATALASEPQEHAQ